MKYERDRKKENKLGYSPDMKFEPANIVFRFPEDDEV
nr:MAG TPA: hypothetical protein [Caudoviricetes sp.]